MRSKYDLFIGGQWITPHSKKYLSDDSPWTGETITEVAAATEEDVDNAVLSAEKAQKIWSRTSPPEKERVLLKAAQIIERNEEYYISCLMEESGSTYKKAKGEVSDVAGIFRVVSGECRRIYGDIIPSGNIDTLSLATRVPRGVVAAIGPYNFPFFLLASKAAFAVATGNGAVLKSSSETPVAAYLIAELLFKAGVPAGLVNAVSGSGSSIGDTLVTHPKVSMITFTGSTEVGRHINQMASQSFKKVCLEMGGKSPMIILKDADVDRAAKKAAFGIFWHQGQVCMANSRIIVERQIYDRFIEKLKNEAERLKIGSAKERDVDIGPIITKKQVATIDEHVQEAVGKGAEIVTGGTFSNLFYTPTILLDVRQNMKVYKEETFGPVACVYKADSADEAVRLANDTPYGFVRFGADKRLEPGKQARGRNTYGDDSYQ